MKHYTNLVTTRQQMNRVKSDTEYFESHHIIPRWLNGDDSKSNLVLLTSHEHYLAHLLLWKHYRTRSSALAFHRLTFSITKKHQRNFTDFQRAMATKAFSYSQTGTNNPQYGKPSWQSGKPSVNKGKKLASRPHMTGDNNPSRRDDVRASISTSLKGKTKTKEHIDKLVAIAKAKPKLTCVHCNKSVDYRNIVRWHGDNCKLYLKE
jgi:hypothetical protein